MAKRKKIAKAVDSSTAKDHEPHLGSHAANTTASPNANHLDNSGTQQTPNRHTNHDRNMSPRWSGGSWRGKATAVAEIARESVTGAVQPKDAPRTPSRGLPGGLRIANKPSPSTTSISRVNATSKASEDTSMQDSDAKNTEEAANDGGRIKAGDGTSETVPSEETLVDDRPPPAAGWRGWWARSKIEDGSQEKEVPRSSDAPGTKNVKPEPAVSDDTSATTTAVNDVDSAETTRTSPKTKYTKTDDEGEHTEGSSKAANRSSWFGLWGTGQQPPTVDTETTSIAPKSESLEPSQSKVEAVSEPNTPDRRASFEDPAQEANQRPASGSWAFWSRDKSRSGHGLTTGRKAQPEVGELAIARSSSRSEPQPAQMSEPKPVLSTEQDFKSLKLERPGPSSEDVSSKKKKPRQEQLSKESQAAGANPEDLGPMQESILKTSIPAARPKKSNQNSKANILLPAFRTTFPTQHSPSYWQQLSRVFSRGEADSRKHLYLSESPHRIKRALAVGIHGYFPAPLLQKVLGQPTGTSFRFANGAAAAVQKWAANRNFSVEVEKVALEGEGTIVDRVDTLWKLLLNWIESIRKADFIIIACHSQGVPVAVSLVDRLLNFGCLNPSARVGICGMAGVNLGPFPSYQSRFYGASASELFDFSKPSSAVSKAYASALSHVLSHHVRITYVGSIDDQLVSIESSTFSNASHPYIYRAVFVDGRIHAPDFLVHLVGFALKLRNLGISDHGLVRELSGPLAGSLYTGEGHSRIYEDPAVYDLAVQHALETATITDASPSLDIRPYEAPGSQAPNPYFLPWAMRGLLEEEAVRKDLSTETDELLGMFNAWKPTSKVLKDVRWRLEAVQSKL